MMRNQTKIAPTSLDRRLVLNFAMRWCKIQRGDTITDVFEKIVWGIVGKEIFINLRFAITSNDEINNEDD